MSDLVARLRTWVHSVDAVPASDLMDEAADEIAILRADNNRRANLEQGLRDGIVRLSQNGDFPAPDNAANRDNGKRLAALQALAALDEELSLPRRTPATHDTPSEGSEQNGCTQNTQDQRRLRRPLHSLAL